MQNYTCFASFFLLPRVLSTSILLSSCKYLDVNGALVCARVLPIPFCSSFRQTSRVVRAPMVTALFEARFAWNTDSQGKPLTYCALDNIFLAKCHFETLVPRAYSFRDSIWVSRLWFWDSMGFETLIPRLYGFRDSDSENVSKNCLHGPCSADSPTLLRMKIWHTWIVWESDELMSQTGNQQMLDWNHKPTGKNNQQVALLTSQLLLHTTILPRLQKQQSWTTWLLLAELLG